jgi:hypothetical protein
MNINIKKVDGWRYYKGNDSEKFADSFAAAVLFPRDLAKEAYDELLKIGQPGIVVNRIKELASRYVISPYTILREMEKYAKRESKSVLNIERETKQSQIWKTVVEKKTLPQIQNFLR